MAVVAAAVDTTLTARVADDCGAEGGKSTGEHPTIESISIDVVGVS